MLYALGDLCSGLLVGDSEAKFEICDFNFRFN